MTRHIAIVSSICTDEFRLAEFDDEVQQIASSLQRCEPTWTFSSFRACEQEFPTELDGIDGVVFSGSPSSVNEPQAWIDGLLDGIRHLHQQRMPMAGICFGHQAIAKALGGQVDRNPGGWCLGAVPVTWSAHAPWMQPAQASLSLYALHKEQVLVPPPGAVITARSAACPVAGFRLGEHIMTTQHHPEMPTGFVAAVLDILERSPEGAALAGAMADARASLALRVDSAVVMRWMANLLS